MAEPSQYKFTLNELAMILVKQAGLTEGKWMVGLEFTLAAGMFGDSPSDAKPGAMMQVTGATLARADNAPDELALVVDAAKVNPPKPAAKKGAPRKRTRALDL